MTSKAETLEAVILSGPRRGEIVHLPKTTEIEPSTAQVEAVNEALDQLNLALERVVGELRTTLAVLKPEPSAR